MEAASRLRDQTHRSKKREHDIRRALMNLEVDADGPQRRRVIRKPREKIEMNDSGCKEVDPAKPVPHAVEFGGIRCRDIGERAHGDERIRHCASQVQSRMSPVKFLSGQVSPDENAVEQSFFPRRTLARKKPQ